MEPITDILGTLVTELIEREMAVGNYDRASSLESAATDASLPVPVLAA
jgi:hypothetical protein